MKTLTPLLALAAAALSFAPAAAQLAPAGGASQIVYYGDLDLSRPEGVRALDRRLRTAVDRACGPSSPVDPVGTRMVRDCRIALRQEIAGRRAEVLAGVSTDTRIAVALTR